MLYIMYVQLRVTWRYTTLVLTGNTLFSGDLVLSNVKPNCYSLSLKLSELLTAFNLRRRRVVSKLFLVLYEEATEECFHVKLNTSKQNSCAFIVLFISVSVIFVTDIVKTQDVRLPLGVHV